MYMIGTQDKSSSKVTANVEKSLQALEEQEWVGDCGAPSLGVLWVPNGVLTVPCHRFHIAQLECAVCLDSRTADATRNHAS